jgi:hypothetical protein
MEMPDREHLPPKGGFMALAGYCRGCGQYVWLNDQWGCVNGHPWTEISNWYDPQTGTPVTPYWLQPATPRPVAAPAPAAPPPEPTPAAAALPAPAPTAIAPPAPSDRLTLLADMLATFGQYPNYTTQYGTDTDMVIGNQIADANWGTGAKRVEFSAIMKAVEGERTIYYWEMIKESGGGLNFGGFDAEMSTTVGMKSWGTKKETVIGPGGTELDYNWDYAATRRIVEDVAARHGWQVKVVLKKNSAQW